MEWKPIIVVLKIKKTWRISEIPIILLFNLISLFFCKLKRLGASQIQKKQIQSATNQ